MPFCWHSKELPVVDVELEDVGSIDGSDVEVSVDRDEEEDEIVVGAEEVSVDIEEDAVDEDHIVVVSVEVVPTVVVPTLFPSTILLIVFNSG